MTTLRLATRNSALALYQARLVQSKLEATHPNLKIELVELVTTGDRIQNQSLAAIGGKGLFIKRLEEALLNDEADFAVHSLKDVPPALDQAFCLAATLERASPFDALVSERYAALDELPRGASVGTCSVRRRAALLHLRPDLNIIDIRGNIDSRLKRMMAGEFDALILAEAGLTRLGLQSAIREIFSIDFCMPSVGQGVIAVECLKNPELERTLSTLNDDETFTCITAERSMNAHLGASCVSPVGSYATIAGEILTLRGVVWSLDGHKKTVTMQEGPHMQAMEIGKRAADELRATL